MARQDVVVAEARIDHFERLPRLRDDSLVAHSVDLAVRGDVVGNINDVDIGVPEGIEVGCIR